MGLAAFPTFTLELWGITACPLTWAGTTISNTPYSFFVMGCESLSQLSTSLISIGSFLLTGEKRTEVSNQECLGGIGSPLPIDNIVVLVHMQTKDLGTLWKPIASAPSRVGNGAA